MGTDSDVFTGEGNNLGDGSTVSLNGPVSVGFNTINKDVYVTSITGSSIRKVVWKQGKTTTLIGSTTGWAPGLVDGPDPNTARLAGPAGLIFRNLGTNKVYICIGDRMNHRVRLMDMTTSAVTTWAGTSSGSTTNVDRLACSFDQPMGVAYMTSIVYVAEYTNNRIARLSFVSNAASVLLSGPSTTQPVAVEGYRGKIFFTMNGRNQFFVVDIYSGNWFVFLGGAYGYSVTAGSVAFNYVYGVAIDCVRKSIFVAEYTGCIVKEVKLGPL